MNKSERALKVNYGQDAPGIRFGMFVIAGIGAGLLALGCTVFTRWRSAPTGLLSAIPLLGLLALLYGGSMGSYMTWSSHVGKRRTRDVLLDRVGQLRPWRGDEVVLDIGCGRGLMLIGAAKKLDRGTAIGLDMWRDEDQSGNTPEAAMENAQREGVADRVIIRTEDARSLSLEDKSVDIVLSHWVVHNLESDQDRRRALNEMWRVLRPGGVIVIADIAHVPSYWQQLSDLAARPCVMLDGGWEAKIMGALSGGKYKPQALLCAKPQ
jgi:ubiquinone/menaquinone biosynthesis C-methylase UbiE